MEKDLENKKDNSVAAENEEELLVDDRAKEVIKEIDITKEMKTSFLNYAMSVIVSRAIPDARDGMKPVHRRILYSMNELGMHSNKPFKKSARIVGEVMGKFHPHGDSAIYESMVRMAQDFSYRYPLVEGHGNFGSVDGDGAAAMRYTEARMSKIAMEILKDLKKDTVDFEDNYDGSEQEPTVLPCKIPNLLVNGATGIAVGMATNIPPHNLTEVIDGLVALIKNPDISIEGLMFYIKGPDFPTGGHIMGISQVRKAYLTGNGAITLRAKHEINDLGNGKQEIVITEIPYQVNKSRLIEKIAETLKNKIIEGVTDLQDETDRNGLRIVLELRRDANANVILNNLFKHTQLQTTFGINLLALVGGQPRVLNIKELLECYLHHQIEVLTRRITFDLQRSEERFHLLEGLIIALDDIDRVIQIIKNSKSGEIAKEALIEEYKLSEIQAKAILAMPLERLTGLEIEKIKNEQVELKKFIGECREILKNNDKKLQIVVRELAEIRTLYGDERKSVINLNEDLDIEDEDLIPVEDVIITITNRGYVKRMSVDTYKPQNRGGKGITATKMAEDDFVEEIIYTSSHDTLLFFTNFGKVYRLRAFQIPYASRIAKGLPIVNLLNFEENERLAAVVNVSSEEKKGEGYLFFVTKKGIVKKTEIAAFKNIRTNGIKAIILNDDDELYKVSLTDGEKDILIGVSDGKAIRFTESDVRPMGRISVGVRGIRTEENTEVVGLAVISTDGDEILIITEKGYGKRTNVDAFRVQRRGGRGVKALNITEKNGKMISLSAVRGDEDLLVVTDKGMIIRTHLEQIQTIGRDTQGVCVIRLSDGHSAATFAIVPRDEEEEYLEGGDDYKEDFDYATDYPFLDRKKR